MSTKNFACLLVAAILSVFIVGTQSQSRFAHREIKEYSNDTISVISSERLDLLDQSIRLYKGTIRTNPKDIALRQSLARTIEDRLDLEEKPNAQLFRECVVQWLVLFHQDKLGSVAASHLEELVGSVPKNNESDDQYLHRVFDLRN